MLQARIGLVKLLQNFEFNTCSRTQIPLKYSPSKLVLSPENGVWLKINKLSWDNRPLNGYFQFEKKKHNFTESYVTLLSLNEVPWWHLWYLVSIISENRWKSVHFAKLWSRVCQFFVWFSLFSKNFLPFFCAKICIQFWCEKKSRTSFYCWIYMIYFKNLVRFFNGVQKKQATLAWKRKKIQNVEFI